MPDPRWIAVALSIVLPALGIASGWGWMRGRMQAIGEALRRIERAIGSLGDRVTTMGDRVSAVEGRMVAVERSLEGIDLSRAVSRAIDVSEQRTTVALAECREVQGRRIVEMERRAVEAAEREAQRVVAGISIIREEK